MQQLIGYGIIIIFSVMMLGVIAMQVSRDIRKYWKRKNKNVDKNKD